MGDLENRIQRLENSGGRGQIIVLSVQYYDGEGPIPAEYAPVDVETMTPGSGRDRITVRYPKSSAAVNEGHHQDSE
jgi:hypothetical protein